MRIVIVDDSGARASVLEEGLREASYDDIHFVPPRGAFVARMKRMAPDVVLMDLGSPSRDTLEEMLLVSRALAKPIAMFVDHSDETMIGAAIDAGVSAYVVDGLRKDRVKPILELAVRRFTAFSRMQSELDEARTALANRKTCRSRCADWRAGYSSRPRTSAVIRRWIRIGARWRTHIAPPCSTWAAARRRKSAATFRRRGYQAPHRRCSPATSVWTASGCCIPVSIFCTSQ